MKIANRLVENSPFTIITLTDGLELAMWWTKNRSSGGFQVVYKITDIKLNVICEGVTRGYGYNKITDVVQRFYNIIAPKSTARINRNVENFLSDFYQGDNRYSCTTSQFCGAVQSL